MIDKEFDQLSMKEKFILQKIVKNKRKNISLTQEEEEIHNKFYKRFQFEEDKAKKKRPLIILMLITTLWAVLRGCS